MATTRPEQLAIGVDIGGTNIRVGVVSSLKGLLSHYHLKLPTPTTWDAFFSQLVMMIQQVQQGLATEQQPAAQAIGVASAGTVDTERGEITGSTGNLPAVLEKTQNGQHALPLAALLAEAVGLSVCLENDANAAAWGEFVLGAGQDIPALKSALMITLGTGVGGGYIEHGQLVRGATGKAAESGHMVIVPQNGRACTCGKQGCWEAYANGKGLTLTAQAILKDTAEAVFQESRIAKTQPDKAKVTNKDVTLAAAERDTLALTVMAQWHADIALGLGNHLVQHDPQVVFIGGGLSKYVDLDLLMAELQARHHLKPEAWRQRILVARLGDDAGMVGAGLSALGRLPVLA